MNVTTVRGTEVLTPFELARTLRRKLANLGYFFFAFEGRKGKHSFRESCPPPWFTAKNKLSVFLCS